MTDRKRKVTWVIKLSKLCNLRCSYCYEFDSLSSRDRIPSEAFPKLFQAIIDISKKQNTVPSFCWHGGEPLLNSTDYLSKIFEAQRNAFQNESIPPRNSIQTNLSFLKKQHVDLLRDNFNSVGVSLDVFGGLRETIKGKDSQDSVLENMETLRKEKVKFGCISVLNRSNSNRVQETFDFFNTVGLNYRVLPFYRSAFNSQIEAFSLEMQHVLEHYKTLFDLWFTHGKGIQINPIREFFSVALAHIKGKKYSTYNKRKQELVFVLDTNGDIYSVADTYDPNFRLGNIFSTSIDGLLSSSERELAIDQCESRIKNTCESCEFYGACSGWPVGEATPIERPKKMGDCPIFKPMVSHAITRIKNSNVLSNTSDQAPHQPESSIY